MGVHKMQFSASVAVYAKSTDAGCVSGVGTLHWFISKDKVEHKSSLQQQPISQLSCATHSKKHQHQTDSLRFKGPSSSGWGHCALGELCRGLNGSLGLLSSGFFGRGEPGRAGATFLSMGDPGWGTFLGVKPAGDLIALFTGGSCGRSVALLRGSSAGREDPAVPSLGEADFLWLGEMGSLSTLPFCFISS